MAAPVINTPDVFMGLLMGRLQTSRRGVRSLVLIQSMRARWRGSPQSFDLLGSIIGSD